MRHVTCQLCPRSCRLSDGENGQCKVRGNRQGKIELLSYGEVTTAIVGTIEHKPIFHFGPGSPILSIGGSGCNMKCGFCQNFEISQSDKSETKKLLPLDVVSMAKDNGAKGIAFTYNEPIVWMEYVMDVCEEAKKAGLSLFLKTNGLANQVPFEKLVSKMSAVNMDLKGNEKEYKEVCLVSGGSLQLVLDNLSVAHDLTHCEISVIMVPSLGVEGLYKLLSRSRDFCGREVPLHLLRFLPDFRMRDEPATSAETMKTASDMAKEFFDFVYPHGWGQQNTICPSCRSVVIERYGGKVVRTFLKSFDQKAYCSNCREPLPIRGL